MKKISDSQVSILNMLKPDINKKFYQISAGEDLYASVDLIFGKGSLARFETAQGSYTMKRQGFFMPYVTLRKDKMETDVAIALLDIKGKTSFTFEGNTYSFRALSLWKNQWGWVNEKNKIIAKYKLTLSGMIRGDVEISRDFLYLPYLELMVAVGTYFLFQIEDELNVITDFNKDIL